MNPDATNPSADIDNDEEEFFESVPGMLEMEDYKSLGFALPPNEDNEDVQLQIGKTGDEDVEGDPFDPFDKDFSIDEILDLQFPTMDQVEAVMLRYGYSNGFVPYKETMERNKDGIIVRRVFVCHRRSHGTKKDTHVVEGGQFLEFGQLPNPDGTLEPIVIKKEKRTMQCGCKWRVQFNLDSGKQCYRASHIRQLEHNHVMLSEEEIQCLPYFRKFPKDMENKIYQWVQEDYEIDPHSVFKRLQSDKVLRENNLTESRERFMHIDITKALYKARLHYRDTEVHNYAQKLIEMLQQKAIHDPDFKFNFRNGKSYMYVILNKLIL